MAEKLSKEKEKRIKKYKRYGKLIYFISRIIRITLRTKFVISEKYTKEKQYSFVFWHGTLFFPMLFMPKLSGKIANLVSASNDGHIATEALELYGFENVRGSSNKDSVRSLVKMVKYIKNGYSGGFAVDGPKGPIYKSKPGAVYVAKKAGIEIVPLGVACSRKWVFEKSWDKFQIPKPFAKVVYIIGEPITVPENVEMDEYTEFIDQKIKEVNVRAEDLLYTKDK